MNKPTTPTQRVLAMRQRRAEQGLVRVEVHAHPDDAGQIKNYAAMLLKRRQPKEQKT